MKSFWGDEIPDRPPRHRRDNAHPAAPGTGPIGLRCGTCAHCVRVTPGAKSFHKCLLMQHCWTHGPGTDIHPRKDAACKHWKLEGT